MSIVAEAAKARYDNCSAYSHTFSEYFVIGKHDFAQIGMLK